MKLKIKHQSKVISKHPEAENQKPSNPTKTMLQCQTSSPLHNFSLPGLKWANPKLLRCMKLPPNALDPKSSVSEPDDEIEDNRRSPDKLKQKVEEESGSGALTKPWNLRTRRAAACKSLNETGAESLKLENRKHKSSSSSPQRNHSPKSLRLRGLAAAAGTKGLEKTKERRKFSTLLSRDEIEEDFLVMTGGKPPRRPKKRPRIVQRQLDTLFPGLWLSEITADTYKVPDEL